MKRTRPIACLAALLLVGSAHVSTYTVKWGDTLSTIARGLGVSTSALADANGLGDPDLIRAGQTLSVPGEGESTSRAAAAVPAGSDTTHRVVLGETTSEIARRYGVSVSAIVRVNDLADANRIRENQMLRIPARSGGAATNITGAVPIAATARAHTVRAGETLDSIARTYAVSVRQLAEENGIRNRNLIRIGQKLRVPASASPPDLPPPLCPVKGATKWDFSNSFGAPRHGGRSHAGNDIFARRGTPVVANVDGTIRHITGTITGLGYYLDGVDGVTYYGAHLDQRLVGEGPVSRGQQIGTVGTTGNAGGTPPHLHFEIKPGGGTPIDPYNLLRAWCS